MLKYALEFALEDKKDEIEKILQELRRPARAMQPLPDRRRPACARLATTRVCAAGLSRRGPTSLRPTRSSPSRRSKAGSQQGADITQELSNAVIANDTARVKFLVGKGADVNKVDNQGATPLTSAARDRHPEDGGVPLLGSAPIPI